MGNSCIKQKTKELLEKALVFMDKRSVLRSIKDKIVPFVKTKRKE
jgi:hypothetical protein